ncbi:Oidioi.mRNA.OKI2018_I69.chr2.g6556.t1.cds [Oikopleura dioica]|uniref:Oidioi.mRNA.OKI2018_I69.chr2.g6556.t1.cds n=1 Tax=Oikopleura dioica TaxID=34765 RepID=A0ABN7T9Z3_OIKDI|nr:Oidioi.mRNA.OKI2018_I69.chr2.g6556.t1.cds [Oikopleura dioica]
MQTWFHEVSRIAPVVILIIYVVQFLETRKLEEIREENFGENQREFEHNLLGQAYQNQAIELPQSQRQEQLQPVVPPVAAEKPWWDVNTKKIKEEPVYQDLFAFEKYNQRPVEESQAKQPVNNFLPKKEPPAFVKNNDFLNNIPKVENNDFSFNKQASLNNLISDAPSKAPGFPPAPQMPVFQSEQIHFRLPKASMFDCPPKNPDCQDGPNAEKKFGVYIRRTHWDTKNVNYMMMKQHHFFNFTEYRIPMPTYLNMVRDPVNRMASAYYFQRYGWGFGSNSSNKFKGSQEDFNRSFDDCVAQQLPECSVPLQVFSKYFCGTSEACNKHQYGSPDDVFKKIAVSAEIAKRNILNEYFFIGLLEHFEDSLFVFENILPDYFRGAIGMTKTKGYEENRKKKSAGKKQATFSNATRSALENGILRDEVDIFKLIQKLFLSVFNSSRRNRSRFLS